jgi:prophage DNA circulation protein
MGLKDTIHAKFRGVPFFIFDERKDGGRKVAVSDFPGADRRVIEDLGMLPGSYMINGFVSGNDWIQKAQRLANALNNPQEGLLECSVFGIVKVKPVTYAESIDQRSVGEIRFRMLFMVSDDQTYPSQVKATSETVSAKVLDVLKAAEDAFVGGYTQPTTPIESQAAEYDLENTVNTVDNAVKRLGSDKISGVTNKVRNIRDKFNDLIRDPVAFGAEIFSDGLLGEVFGSMEASKDALKAMRELTALGSNFSLDFETAADIFSIYAGLDYALPVWGEDTYYRKNNSKNRVNLVSNVRAASLAMFADLAARTDYRDDDEIIEVQKQIDEAYTAIALSDTLPVEVIQAVERCRIEALRVLEEKLQVTPNIVQYDTTPTLDIELAYRLYAEDFATVTDAMERADVLADLNGLLPARFTGNVKVLRR